MAGSSRACGNTEEKIRNDEELSKASALRELEKARVRECQMEKTVRWWTVCTAGWRKKWSKLRQENEELRKQIKTHKTQLNGITQDCAALNNKLEFFNAHNSFLKCEINKLILKYGDEVDEHIREILNSPDIIKPKMYICSDCKVNKDEAKSIEKSLTSPEAGGGHETKNVEVLTDMISKIFAELQNLKGEFVKQNEGPDYKDLLEFPMSPDQITQLKIYSLNKQLEKERLENQDLLKKLEQANTEISMLNGKLEEMTVGEFLLDPEPKMPDSLSDEE